MKSKIRRYAEGGLGYEENPMPGIQSDKKPSSKKPGKSKDKTPPRRVSPMEFIKKYEDSEPSEKTRKEAKAGASMAAKANLPGDRSTGFGSLGKSMYADLDEKRAKEALGSMAEAAAAGMGGAAAGAKLGLRAKQTLRRMQTARANAAERAADKASEAGRRGMSRRGIPRYDERYRAGNEASDFRAAQAKELPEGLKFKRGGAVKSSASKRGDGIAKRGKTKGRMI
jgi:hypothetical protein